MKLMRKALLLKSVLAKEFQGRSEPFKTQHLACAFDTMLASDNDMIIISQTGSGKSSLFEYPMYLETDKIGVVVFPMISLLHNQAKKHERNKMVRVLDLLNREALKTTQSVRLLFVQLEHLTEAMGLIQHWAANSRLSRIFVDQCHLAITHGFRSAQFGYLGLLASSALLGNVQKVFLTATLPVSRTSELKERLSCNNAAVLRDGATPKNLEFVIKEFESRQSAKQRMAGESWIFANDRLLLPKTKLTKIEDLDSIKGLEKFFQVSQQEISMVRVIYTKIIFCTNSKDPLPESCCLLEESCWQLLLWSKCLQAARATNTVGVFTESDIWVVAIEGLGTTRTIGGDGRRSIISMSSHECLMDKNCGMSSVAQ